MNDARDSLIAEQQLEIKELRGKLKEYDDAREEIRSTIYCIGGPLNDNKLGYTKEQMQDFQKIIDALG